MVFLCIPLSEGFYIHTYIHTYVFRIPHHVPMPAVLCMLSFPPLLKSMHCARLIQTLTIDTYFICTYEWCIFIFVQQWILCLSLGVETILSEVLLLSVPCRRVTLLGLECDISIWWVWPQQPSPPPPHWQVSCSFLCEAVVNESYVTGR